MRKTALVGDISCVSLPLHHSNGLVEAFAAGVAVSSSSVVGGGVVIGFARTARRILPPDADSSAGRKSSGTPIIAFNNADGEKVALFGPVITSVPSPALSLQLWDGFFAVATVPGFWELKRTRTASP